MTDAFQWIDGSFLEDVEVAEGRPPRDIDVVTFYWSADPDFSKNLAQTFPDILNHAKIKADFRTDHFPMDIGYHPATTVEITRFWTGLFSHTRAGVWKGMLRVDLNTEADDVAASVILDARP
jgi:hypothetical protein